MSWCIEVFDTLVWRYQYNSKKSLKKPKKTVNPSVLTSNNKSQKL